MGYTFYGCFCFREISVTLALTCFLSLRRGHYLAQFLVGQGAGTNPATGLR